MKMKSIRAIVLSMLLIFSLGGCTPTQVSNDGGSAIIQTSDSGVSLNGTASAENNSDESSSRLISTIEGSALELTEMFSELDLEQSADLTDAVFLTLKSNEDVIIDEEGVYVLSGAVENVTVVIEAAEDEKVQIVLDGVRIINEDSSAIYVKTADKVWLTTTDSENYMEVSGSFVADGDTNLDAVIFSTSDLVINGTGTLEIVSAQGNGITSKDDLKITGGTYLVTSSEDGFEANDSILIYDGDITIVSNKDALHSENDEDTSLGYIYIQNGTFNINAADDAIRGTSIVQIDGGTIDVETCREGIEGTFVQINGGEINIYAKDDGINATPKSSYDVVIEVNGGTIHVSMGSGDTDAFDSNGDIYINGGTIEIEANSAFDSDGTAQLNGGDVMVNGETITQITQSQMGGGKHR